VKGETVGLKQAKNYILAVLGGLVLLAGVLLILLQWGNETENFSLYGRSMTDGVNLALLMGGSAVGGVVLWFMLRMFLASTMGIWRSRRNAQKLQKMADKAIAQSAPAPKPAPAPEPEPKPDNGPQAHP